MILIDWVYINIYGQTQRLDNMNRTKIDGDSWTSVILGIFLGGWFPFFRTLYYYFRIGYNVDLSQTGSYITVFLSIGCAAVIYIFYQKDNRSFKIYEKYLQANEIISKWQAFFLGIFLMLIPYVFWVIILLVLK